jgi:adenylylsulfate kinase-like enzyme
MVIWLTGLPGAGKTTLAQILLDKLRALGKQSVLLDGDKLRVALGQHNYDMDSRKSLSKTYGLLGKMFSEQGCIAICATVSMFDDVRAWNAENINNYCEVYIKVSPEILQKRNQKSLYTVAATGHVANVLGSDITIQEPKTPDLVLINDGLVCLESLIDQILKIIKEQKDL